MKHFGEFVLLFALANLPFFSERLFFVIRLAKKKAVFLRMLELVAYYFVAGVFLGAREVAENGSRYAQNWEFFAITMCLFAVFAYPGFVYRHLWSRELNS
ncbi:MAG: DUF2818 family protein [Proteobacteria bacterium]|nr:DUF2818 family protein [Pseudomonadota bacterium]RTL25842.1 MAG: DUF2818 family protein [Rhodocyclaceae bacterium]